MDQHADAAINFGLAHQGKTKRWGMPKAKILSFVDEENLVPDVATAQLLIDLAFLRRKTWNGDSYVSHCLYVADIQNNLISDDEKIAGLLHDMVEDTDWTLDDFKKIGFSENSVRIVDGLTKRKDEKYFNFIERCSKNRHARRIKLRDLKHNMDPTRAPRALTEKQIYYYPPSFAYLLAVETGQIKAGSSIWNFLQNNTKYLEKPESLKVIASETSRQMPQGLAAMAAVLN